MENTNMNDNDTRGELAVLRMETEILWPAKVAELEDALHGALLLLDRVDMSELAATPRWSDWISFEKERRELWGIFNRLVRGQKGA